MSLTGNLQASRENFPKHLVVQPESDISSKGGFQVAVRGRGGQETVFHLQPQERNHWK